MRSKLTKSLFIIFALVLVFMFVSCANGNTDTDTNNDPTVVAISVDISTVPHSSFAGELDISQIRINVTLSDGTKDIIPATMSMVALESRSKLDIPGTHTIKLVHQSCETKFQIVLLNKDKKQYSLRVYSGVPIAINGINLDEEIYLDGDYFEAQYDEGTIVTLEWVSVDGYFFDYWTDNDKKTDTQSITMVTMNEVHTYRAYSEAIINSVSFVTNSGTGIGNRVTNYLNESDIPQLKREGYVFDGWTTENVTGDGAVDNTTAVKISFPYNVRVETTLYGLWRTLGIGYEINPSMSASGVIGYKILSYSKNDTEIIIPDKHNNLPIIGIAENAFSGATMVRKLVLPASIEEIEDGSFKNCSQLSEITISGTSNTYSSVDGILFNKDNTELIVYPSNRITAVYNVPIGVENIKSYALYNCLIGGIVLPSTIRRVGNFAFNSVHLDYVDFSTVNPTANNFSLGDNLFHSNLNTIYVDSKDRNSYANHAKIASYVQKLHTDIGDKPTINIDNDKTLIYKVINNENSRFPATTSEIIGANRTLTSIRIPVNLHYEVSSIGVQAFNDCILLSSVEFPLSSKLERIQDGAFEDTIWIKTKTEIVANNILYKYLGSASTYTLGSAIKEIAEGAFKNNKTLKKLDLTHNIDLIYVSAYAFYGCTAFEGDTTNNGITFKDKLVSIGNYAFAHTKLLNFALTPGAKLESVGEYAFSDCYYLLSMAFSAETLEIANTAFSSCYSLASFYVPQNDNSVFISINDILYKYDKENDSVNKPSTLYLYPAGKMIANFNINDPNNTGIESLTVTRIGTNAFSYSNIAMLYIPESVISVGTNAINVPGLICVTVAELSSTMTYLGMFGQHKPDYIMINEDNDFIDNYFDSNSTLKGEKYSQELLDIVTLDGDMIFAQRDGITRLVRTDRAVSEIVIPSTTGINTVAEIGQYAFYGYYLQSVYFSGVESYFASNAFAMAQKLYNIYTVEGASVPEIEEDTFSSLFDNGLMIYVSYNGSNKDNYKTRWNLRSDRYLIDIDIAQPRANFRPSTDNEDIGIIEPIYGIIDADNMPVPNRNGYQFVGWLDSDTNTIISLDYNIPYNIELVCVWEKKTFTINFVVETNAYMPTKTYQVVYDNEYEFPQPIYANMILLHWKTASGEIYHSEGLWEYALNVDTLTLYPVWEDKQYVLEYQIDENMDVDGISKQVLYNTYFALSVPTRDGYKFLGWYMLIDGQQIMLTDNLGDSFLRWSYSDSDTVPVFAQWEQKTLSVNLYLQYTNETDFVLYKTVLVTYGQSFELVFDNDFVDSAWHKKDIFCGWYDDTENQSGIGVRYCDENGMGLFDWNIGQDSSLYAQWPIEISSSNQLNNLSANDLTKSYVLVSDITIDKPIGNKDNPYSGLFNGNGYTVTLNYDLAQQIDNFDGYVGLFAYNKGTIKNVKLVANINMENLSVTTPIYVGGLVGYNEGKIYATDSSIIVKSNIIIDIATVANNNINIGGLAGLSSGTITRVGVEIELSVVVEEQPYDGGYNIGNTIGFLDGGTLDGGNSGNQIYYYTDNNDYFKNKVCGLDIGGTIIEFSPNPLKK